MEKLLVYPPAPSFPGNGFFLSVSWMYLNQMCAAERLPEKAPRCTWAASLLPGESTAGAFDLAPRGIIDGKPRRFFCTFRHYVTPSAHMNADTYRKRKVTKATNKIRKRVSLPGIDSWTEGVVARELGKPEYDAGKIHTRVGEIQRAQEEVHEKMRQEELLLSLEAMQGRRVRWEEVVYGQA